MFDEKKTIRMSEGQAQEEFAFAFGEFIAWVKARGWRIRLSEVGVSQLRSKIILTKDGETEVIEAGPGVKIIDSTHRHWPVASLHYNRRAADVNLIVPGTRPETGGWVAAGGSKEWAEAHAMWAALHPNCRYGNGKGTDDNHLSFVKHAGEKY
jgi:hypothetical protein